MVENNSNDFENNNFDLFDNYQRYTSINEYLRHLATKFPDFCKVETIGKSYEDREINILRISNNFKGPKPVVFVEAGCHVGFSFLPPSPIWTYHNINFSGPRMDWHIGGAQVHSRAS